MRSEIARWWLYVRGLWNYRNWYERLAMLTLHLSVLAVSLAVTGCLFTITVIAAVTIWQFAIALAFMLFLAWAVWVVNRD